jgi:hypothetical protein
VALMCLGAAWLGRLLWRAELAAAATAAAPAE